MKVVLRIFIPLCVFSFIAFGISVMFLGTQPENTDTAISELVISSDSASTYDITDSFTSIKADIGAYKLTIAPWQENYAQVTVSGDNSDRITAEVSGDRLTIRSDWNWDDKWNWSRFGSLFDGSAFSTEVLLKVPDKTYGQVMMYVGAGNLASDGIRAKDIYFNVGAGKLTYTQPAGFCADHISADVSAGNLVVRNAAAGSYEFDVSAGNADIYGLTGSGSVDISAGSAKLQFNELSGECSVDVSAGDVTLDIPEDSSARFICDKSAGDIRIMAGDENRHADDGDVISINGGKTDVDLSVSAGSIKVLSSTASAVEQNSAAAVTTGTYAEADVIEAIEAIEE